MANILDINSKEISVEQVRNDWAMVLMTRGVIVKLAISKWPAYARLTPEILGLKFVDKERTVLLPRLKIVGFRTEFIR